ncbi:MAG TPA: hypothetical protein ENN21_07945 [Spirochaetes bacterium]|nr:hypothetical protein [Spirochaetota bacterium]
MKQGKLKNTPEIEFHFKAVLVAAVLAVLLALPGCSPNPEGEAARYRRNAEAVERLISEYPRFGRFLAYENEKARSLWYGAQKTNDRARRVQMILRANEVFYSSPLLGHLYSYDGRRARIRRNVSIIEPYGSDGKFRVRVRRVVKTARTALDRAGRLMSRARPAGEQAAVDLVRRADEMLVRPEALVLRVKKAIRDDKPRQK